MMLPSPTFASVALLPRVLALAACLALTLPGAAGAQVADTVPDSMDREMAAQGIENPLVPRGALHFQFGSTTSAIQGFHGEDGLRRIGSGSFLVPALGTEQLPELAPTEARFRDLMGNGSNWSLNLGSTGGRFESDEQRVTFRAGYGLLDRVTIGISVPMVRRRVSSALTLAGAGATAGANPSTTDAADVSAFLSAAGESLAALEALVQAACTPDDNGNGSNGNGENGNGSNGQTAFRCEEGQELLGRASGFVQALEAAYQEELIFPLRESTGGQALSARWASLMEEFEGWEVQGPASPPLARQALSPEAFAGEFVEPAWGASGFPLENPREYTELGDVEGHLVLGLLRLGDEGEGYRIRSSAVLSARLATGAQDSLQTVVRHHPPGGVSGFGVRLVTDLISPSRFALLTVVEGWSYGEAEALVLAPDPTRVLGANAVARAPVRWEPGGSFRLRVTPRFHLTPGLSLGLGYEMDRHGSHQFQPEGEGIAAWSTDGTTLHRIRAELRYHGFEGPVVEALPFPLELLLAYDGTAGGTGDFAPSQRRLEVGARILRRR
jgi:hypothetical protein